MSGMEKVEVGGLWVAYRRAEPGRWCCWCTGGWGQPGLAGWPWSCTGAIPGCRDELRRFLASVP